MYYIFVQKNHNIFFFYQDSFVQPFHQWNKNNNDANNQRAMIFTVYWLHFIGINCDCCCVENQKAYNLLLLSYRFLYVYHHLWTKINQLKNCFLFSHIFFLFLSLSFSYSWDLLKMPTFHYIQQATAVWQNAQLTELPTIGFNW